MENGTWSAARTTGRSARHTSFHRPCNVEVVAGSELLLRPVGNRTLCELDLQMGGDRAGVRFADIVASPLVPIGVVFTTDETADAGEWKVGVRGEGVEGIRGRHP